MKKEINPTKLTLNSIAKKQVLECLGLVKEVFGQDLLGVYLYGSSIVGGLQKYSDIDLFVVSNRATTLEEKNYACKSIAKHFWYLYARHNITHRNNNC